MKEITYTYILNILRSPEGANFVDSLDKTNKEVEVEDLGYIHFIKWHTVMSQWDDDRIHKLAERIYNKYIEGEIKIPEKITEGYSSHKYSFRDRYIMHSMHKLFYAVLSSVSGLLFLEMIEKLNKELFVDEEFKKNTEKAKNDYKKAITCSKDGCFIYVSGKMALNLCNIALYLMWCDLGGHLKLNTAAIHLLSEISEDWFYHEHFNVV